MGQDIRTAAGRMSTKTIRTTIEQLRRNNLLMADWINHAALKSPEARQDALKGQVEGLGEREPSSR
jgi:hypothetical protein